MRKPLQNNQQATIAALVIGAIIWPVFLYLRTRRKR